MALDRVLYVSNLSQDLYNNTTALVSSLKNQTDNLVRTMHLLCPSAPRHFWRTLADACQNTISFVSKGCDVRYHIRDLDEWLNKHRRFAMQSRFRTSI